ncbi:TPA: beta-channel forming cytolysin [Bacillus cereus]
MKIKKLLLASALLICNLCVLGRNAVVAQEQTDVIDIGQGVHVYTSFSTFYNKDVKVKTSIKASIIDDKKSNVKMAIISTDGSNLDATKEIQSTIFPGSASGETTAKLKWPSSYGIEMQLFDQNAQFYKVAPSNTVDTKSVTSSVGYTIGGGIKISDKPDASALGSVNFLTSVKYDQSDYKTFLTSDTDKKVSWNVSFISAINQGYGPYDRDSSDLTYGNQLFMKSRAASIWAKENFLSDEQMPGLASYGFSPGVIAVIMVDKNVKTPSKLKIQFGRSIDSYNLRRNGLLWVGHLQKNIGYNFSAVNYKIDWENNKLIL